MVDGLFQGLSPKSGHPLGIFRREAAKALHQRGLDLDSGLL